MNKNGHSHPNNDLVNYLRQFDNDQLLQGRNQMVEMLNRHTKHHKGVGGWLMSAVMGSATMGVLTGLFMGVEGTANMFQKDKAFMDAFKEGGRMRAGFGRWLGIGALIGVVFHLSREGVHRQYETLLAADTVLAERGMSNQAMMQMTPETAQKLQHTMGARDASPEGLSAANDGIQVSNVQHDGMVAQAPARQQSV